MSNAIAGKRFGHAGGYSTQGMLNVSPTHEACVIAVRGATSDTTRTPRSASPPDSACREDAGRAYPQVFLETAPCRGTGSLDHGWERGERAEDIGRRAPRSVAESAEAGLCPGLGTCAALQTHAGLRAEEKDAIGVGCAGLERGYRDPSCPLGLPGGLMTRTGAPGVDGGMTPGTDVVPAGMPGAAAPGVAVV